MTNFATFIDTGNKRAPIAQRGKAKQKRADLRLVGLGLVVTRDGGIPLTWHAYPGNKPDVTQFPEMIPGAGRYQAVCGLAGRRRQDGGGDDRGIRRRAEHRGQLRAPGRGTGCTTIGSVPASDCPDLLAVPASARTVVDTDRFGRLTAYDTRRRGLRRRAARDLDPLPGAARRPRRRGFDGTTLAKAGKKLDELAATLARGKTRRPRDKVEAEITTITAKPWVRRVITWQLTGDQPRDLRLTWSSTPPRGPRWKRRSSASTC